MKRLILLMFLTSDFYTARAQTPNIRISAGEFERVNSIIPIKLSRVVTKANYVLKDKSGNIFPVQRDTEGNASTILTLAAGETKTYRLVETKKERPGVSLKKTEAEIKFSISGKQVIGFQTGKRDLPEGIEPVYLRGGYLQPIFSPSGLQVSDDYPLNHKHHHGIWSAWTKTEFEGRHPDFWNMGDKTGTVLLEKILKTQEGPVFGQLKSRNIFVDKSAAPEKHVLNEDWDIKVYNISGDKNPYRVFDLQLKQECSSPNALKLPEYSYGGLGFRGNWLWNGEKNTIFLTSEGKDRSNGHGTRANWCYIGGMVNGMQTGIVIMSHPENFRSPQPMRIHPTEPFFCFAPPQAGAFEIKPGEIYRSKYRFIVFDGEPNTDFINSLWQDYAHPARAVVKP